MIRPILAALLAAASNLPAQDPSFVLSGPTLVDISQLPRNPVGDYIVTLSGSGFVRDMVLAASVGAYGPFILPYRFVDSHMIEMLVHQPGAGVVAFALLKSGASNNILVTPIMTTQFITRQTVSPNSVFVSLNGSDGNPGTLTAPFRTIGRGIQALAPGMTLYIRGGTYYERPVVAVSGTAAQPIAIQSFPGEQAVIDSGTPSFRLPGNSDWEVVDPAIGEYRSVTAAPSGAPYGYVAGIPGYENGRVGLVPYTSGAAFRSRSETYVNATTPFYVGPGLYRDAATGRLHVRLQKTKELRRVEARYGQVFDTDVPIPKYYSIIVSQAATTLTIRGSHLVIRDLTVHQAVRSIHLPDTVTDVRLENVEAWLGDSAIESSGAGSDGIVITRCRVYGDVPRWIFWTDAKDPPAPADRMRQTSIDFFNGAHDVEISYNHVRGGHDLVGVNTDEDRFLIHHNVFMNCHDDAAELEGTTDVGRIEFYDNYVLNALVAVAPGQDTPATRGPIIVHNNVFADLRNPPINRRPGIVAWNGGGQYGFEYMLKQHSGNTFYYNNTMIQLNHGGDGINLTPARPAGTWCFNNILVMVNGRVNGGYRTGVGQIVDGNLYWKINTVDPAPLTDRYHTVGQLYSATGLEQHGLGTVPGRGTDPRFAGLALNILDRSAAVWELDAASEAHPISAFLLAAGSPARNAGIAVPSHPIFGVLPNADAWPDLGAMPFGGSMVAYSGFPFDQVQ